MIGVVVAFLNLYAIGYGATYRVGGIDAELTAFCVVRIEGIPIISALGGEFFG